MRVNNKPTNMPNHLMAMNKFFEILEADVDNDNRYSDIDLMSFNLVEVNMEDMIEGDLYINLDGHLLRYYTDEVGEPAFDFIKRSPLYIWKGDTVEGLTPLQFKLFWILMKNEEANGF